MNYKSVLLNPSDTIEKAIHVLNSEPFKIILVVNDKRALLGTITDGDIRRALILKKDISTDISDVMFNNPTVANERDSKKEVLSIMKKNSIMQVPILNENRVVVGLETMQQLLHDKVFDNPVILMAGGFGKRLQPLTNDTPKPLLKVGNRPILETILEQFVNEGFNNFFISLHFKSEMIKDYFGDGSKWGVNIQYIVEKEPLGTAGVLGLIPEISDDKPILFMNGDLLTKVNFERLLSFHSKHGGKATMCVREYDFQVPYGVIETSGYIIKDIVEKPIHNFFVNAGIYVFDYNFVRDISKNNYLDMPDLIKKKISQGEEVNIFPIHEYWVDIGRLEEYDRAHIDFIKEFGDV